ncbi:MAG TPA: peptidylprolyl isomerase [Terrimicrobiaceae bacterium]|nr:peptidylprolyl isomerase [Terrimicrobiaceae bacterium]
MKILISVVAIVLAALGLSSAATVGPEVAVMQIKIGKERALQQVVIGLYDDAAPATVANFKELCRKRFYNGMRFHRVFPSALVQTGDPMSRRGVADRSGTGGPGYTIPAELGRNHVRGTVAMSRLGDTVNPSKASNGSQFYVCLTPMPKLDGKYTVFGEVLEGLDVLDSISNQPSDSNDFPLAKIVIKSITIQPRFFDTASQ